MLRLANEGQSRGSHPTNRLVRVYSDRWQQNSPDDTLQRGLAAKVAHDRDEEGANESARHKFDGLLTDTSQNMKSFVSPLSSDLEAAYKKLEIAWQKFQQELPKDERMGVKGTPPDFKLVWNKVTTAHTTLMARRSEKGIEKGKNKFRNFCKQIHSHSNVLSIFPKDEKYVSMFTGALTTCVQAAVTYLEMQDQIERTLSEIGDVLEYWDGQMRKLSLERMYKYIVELYVVMFEFLTQVFERWCKSGMARFRSSMNENILKSMFVDTQTRLDAIQGKLDREISAYQWEQMDKDRKQSEKDRQQYRLDQQQSELGRQRVEEDLGKLRMMMEQVFLAQGTISPAPSLQVIQLSLGADIQALLEGRAYGQPNEQISLSVRPATNNLTIAESQEDRAAIDKVLPSIDEDGVLPAMDRGTEQAGSRSAITSRLMQELDPLKVSLASELAAISDMTSRIKRLEVDSLVRNRVITWMESSTGSVLWILGPHGVSRPSQNTTTAVLLTALTRQSNTRCVQYFCGVSSPPTAQSREAALMCFVISLITQLIVMIPVTQLSTLKQIQQHVTALRKGDIEFDDALDLLDGLRIAIMSPIVFLIDCFQDLEDRSDVEHTTRLLQTLGALCSFVPMPDNSSGDESTASDSLDDGRNVDKQSGEANGAITKICFTTDGYVDALGIADSESLLEKVEYVEEANEAGCNETAILM